MDEKSKEKSVDSRYLASRREWLERYGDYISSAKNWRMMALGALPVMAILAGGLVYEADRVHTVIRTFEVNKLGDAVHFGQEISNGTYDQPIVTHVLARWIDLVRSRIPAFQAEKQQYNESYYYISSGVQSSLNAYFRRHNPYNDFVNKSGGRTVTITSALPLGKLTRKGGTYQIDWTETQYTRGGAIKSRSNWQGTVTYTVTSPTAASINTNPFGIYITNFNWNQTI